MEVVITAAAKLDLFKIGEDIRREAPARADSFVQTLVDHCAQLAEMPRRYPLVPRYEDHGIRRCVHGNYLIFYRLHVELDVVEVIHILHGARDYESLLFPDA
ncbi:MAG: type II toxin-antitoxin system RelE/ParE family toxin [Terriglobales bacterium]|jgi:toxin ParE1/3/4